MKSDKNIVFLGMMGSGKTSIGSLVAKKLKLDFFDIDDCIEMKLNMKISKIFEEKGEKFFRTFEEKATLDVLKKKNTVIALGGGAFLNTNIRREILINHLSFWLKLDTKTLINRIIKSSKRPIAIKSSKSELAEMINNRNKLYSKALFKVDCNNLTKIKIVNNILNIYDDQETIC